MKKAKKQIKPMLIISILFILFISYHIFIRNEEVQALSKYGSRGQEVITIQTKLKRWGYYNGNIDGIYGSQTLAAVKYFQRKNGLAVDGIAGTRTLRAMGIYTSSSSSSSSSNSNNLNLLARVVYGEARGEPYIGQVAVGAVIMNRVKDPSFPNTIAGVIYQDQQFSSIRDGQFDVAIDEDSTVYKAAQDAMNGIDPTNGALYFYNHQQLLTK